jgi:hypothetical protein
MGKIDPVGTETWQLGFAFDVGTDSGEAGVYREQTRNDPVTAQYPTETGKYITAANGPGILFSANLSLTHCKTCTSTNLQGNAQAFQVALGPFNFAVGKTSGKPTETFGFGMGAGLRFFSDSVTKLLPETGLRVPDPPWMKALTAQSSRSIAIKNPINATGALSSVTFNKNGSVTGHYQPVTGSLLGDNKTICPSGKKCD